MSLALCGRLLHGPLLKTELFCVRYFVKLLPSKEFQYGDMNSVRDFDAETSVNKKSVVAQC